MIFFISVLINADDLYLGGIAQLVEHLPCKQGVIGSNPIISTSENDRRSFFLFRNSDSNACNRTLLTLSKR